MDQVRLGVTGLHVSRVCLGMMSYGNDSDRPKAGLPRADLVHQKSSRHENAGE